MSVGRRRATDGQTPVQTASDHTYLVMRQEPTATMKKRPTESSPIHTSSVSAVFLPAESSSVIVIPAPPDATYTTRPVVPVIKRPTTIVAIFFVVLACCGIVAFFLYCIWPLIMRPKWAKDRDRAEADDFSERRYPSPVNHRPVSDSALYSSSRARVQYRHSIYDPQGRLISPRPSTVYLHPTAAQSAGPSTPRAGSSLKLSFQRSSDVLSVMEASKEGSSSSLGSSRSYDGLRASPSSSTGSLKEEGSSMTSIRVVQPSIKEDTHGHSQVKPVGSSSEMGFADPSTSNSGSFRRLLSKVPKLSSFKGLPSLPTFSSIHLMPASKSQSLEQVSSLPPKDTALKIDPAIDTLNPVENIPGTRSTLMSSELFVGAMSESHGVDEECGLAARKSAGDLSTTTSTDNAPQNASVTDENLSSSASTPRLQVSFSLGSESSLSHSPTR